VDGGCLDRARPCRGEARGRNAGRSCCIRASRNYLLVDDVFIEPAWLDGWRSELTEIELLLVGVMAPLHVLEEREAARGNRIAGEARAQVDLIHRGVEYDLTVDTSLQSPEECARSILAALG